MEKSPKKSSLISRFPLILLLPLFLTPAVLRSQTLKSVLPDAIVVQYAGSIGFGSIGAGYDLFKGKGNVDLVYGFVPKSKGGSLHIATAKFAYRPFTLNITKNIKFHPLNPGVFGTYTFGKEFNTTWDKNMYEKGYYWWSPAIRAHASISNELKLNTRRLLHDEGLKSVSLYSEFNINDLYLTSWFKNRKTTSLWDYTQLGIGMRMYF